MAVTSFGPGAFLTVIVLIGMGMITAWVRWQGYFFGKAFFLTASVAMFLWLLATLGELQSSTLACKMFWSMAAWPAIATVPTAWALFLHHYAFSRREGQARLERAALIAGPAVITLIAWTNPWHGLLYGPMTRLVETEGAVSATYDHGPLFYAVAVYLYIFLAAAIGIVSVGAFQARRAHRAYFMVLVFITSVPMAANLTYVVFKATVFGFDPTPFAFSVVLFLITWLIYTNRLFDITTVARDLLFFNVRNPVLVVDDAAHVVGANPEAMWLFRGPGARLGARIADWPHLSAFEGVGTQSPSARVPLALTVDGRDLQVQITPINKPMGRDNGSMGAVVLLNDTTEIQRKNRQLEDALAVNLERLREIMALRDDLERQLLLDPLTGVNNRRGLEATFLAACTASQPDEGPLVLALLDIDHFKAINDRFGHSAGDRVLRDFARLMRARIDPHLSVFRVGGEEFVVIFPTASLADITDLLERFRLDLTTSKFTRISDPVRVSFSAGLATWPADGLTLDAVFKQADDRLYAAKVAGRGCTVSMDDPPKRSVNEGL